MARTSSYSLTPDAQAALDARAGRNKSAALSRVLERYAELVRRSTPDLFDAEWSLIYDALSGTLEEPWSIAAMELGIEDAIRLDGLAAKWEVDGNGLLLRLRALDYGGKLAVVDAAERWWAKGSREEE